MNEHVMQQLDESIKRNKKAIDLGKALDRLRSNRDFKLLIQEGYFTGEAVRLVHALGDPNLQDAEKQYALTQDMRAIGALNTYFRVIDHQAVLAEKALADDEAMREELNQGAE